MKNISKREYQIMEEIRSRGLTIFTPLQVRRFLHLSDHNTNRLLARMVNKDLIRRVENGKYILSREADEKDVYELATHLISPCYLSLWSALHFHGMTEQVPSRVYVSTTRRKAHLMLQGREIVFVTIANQHFFGYERVGTVVVSDREKTLLDCLRHMDKAGGPSHIFGSIPDDLDLDRLLEYCRLMGTSSVVSRLGYMLDLKGIVHRRDDLRSLVTSYSKLDPHRGTTNLDRYWKLYRNRVME